MPEPVSRYQGPNEAGLRPPASQIRSSALLVPLSSPRDTKVARPAAILAIAAAASSMPETAAGSADGPTMTKSLYITLRLSMPNPVATNAFSAWGSCTKSASASPWRASRMAWPVPTAITRTVTPVALVNRGRMWPNSPEFCVEVVEATVMNVSAATPCRITPVRCNPSRETIAIPKPREVQKAKVRRCLLRGVTKIFKAHKFVFVIIAIAFITLRLQQSLELHPQISDLVIF